MYTLGNINTYLFIPNLINIFSDEKGKMPLNHLIELLKVD